jgi:DNA-binding LacI/PurR family transcriptional regulator
MADIARRAGVSRIAVSYALNGRPGVSADLRQRILGIARELGYRANGPALALHGAAAHAIGLVLLRSSAALTVEVFRRQLIAGIQEELAGRGFGLALQLVADLAEEAQVHRRWSAERRVDGVLICDPRVDDPRIAGVRRLGLPAALIASTPDDGLPGAWCDDKDWTRELVAYLAGLGHVRVARVSGPAGMVHTTIRDETMAQACAERGIALTIVRADYTGEAGARATRELLAARPRPTAIVYDNDIMAIAGLAAAQELGFAVPAELSIVAWDDSPICGLVHPPLTALTRDIVAYGENAARLLLAVIAGDRVESRLDEPARLIARASTAAPPAPS